MTHFFLEYPFGPPSLYSYHHDIQSVALAIIELRLSEGNSQSVSH